MDNIAFAKQQNDGTNMFLFDYGGLLGRLLNRTNVLNGVKRVIAFGSHIHVDHIGGALDLSRICKEKDIELLWLLPTGNDLKRQRVQLVTSLLDMGVPRLNPVMPDEAADMMNLKRIDFDVTKHARFNAEFTTSFFKKIDSTALIMTRKTDEYQNKIVVAEDHRDKKFVIDTLKDPTLDTLYTDMTFKKHGLGSHFTVKKYDKIFKEENFPKKRKLQIVGMHFIRQSVADYAKESGYNVATDRIYGTTPQETTTPQQNNFPQQNPTPRRLEPNPLMTQP